MSVMVCERCDVMFDSDFHEIYELKDGSYVCEECFIEEEEEDE